MRRASGNALPVNGPGVDPEIDSLLQDEGADSPPYSPVENAPDPDLAWRGTITMDSVATFSTYAKHVGGANLSKASPPTPWKDLLPKELKVAGRIDRAKANEYLCAQRYSLGTDVILVEITQPQAEEATDAYNNLVKYFLERDRFGVLANKSTGNIRDTYLVPIAASPVPIHDFIQNLEGHKIPEERTKPVLIVVIVVRPEASSTQPQLIMSFDGTSDAHSPSLQHPHHRQMSMSGSGPQMSPLTNQHSFPPPPNGSDHGVQYQPHQPPQRTFDEQRAIDQHAGEEVAKRILGPYVQAPTVSFLMPQAYQMRPLEWEAIRKILERDHQAQSDLTHLSRVLAQGHPDPSLQQQSPAPSHQQ